MFETRGGGRALVAAVVVALFFGGTVAVAGELITSREIKNGTLKKQDLSKRLRQALNQTLIGGPGPAGPQGPVGPPGAGTPYENPEWGVIARTTTGSGVAQLRGGPYGSFGVSGPAAQPPFGQGSLGIQVSDQALSGTPEESVAFGNEVDFLGDLVTGLTAVGFHVFQTEANADIAATNLPTITLEVDPNLDGVAANHSTLVFAPDPPAVIDRWSGYLDATTSGGWHFGEATAAAATGCTPGSPCTFAALQASLAADDLVDDSPATILTVAVAKGPDDAWVGAVDGLRVNGAVYDFEPFGIVETVP